MMARRARWKTLALVLALLALALAGSSAAGPASAQGRGPSDDVRASGSLDVSSSAIPTVAQPLVTDSARSDTVLGPGSGKAVATAVSTSNCNGCSGSATALQTVSVSSGAPAMADNAATAWSNCANCSSSAVSVQIVTGSSASSVTANNRSLALNVACTSCTTTAVALQFVVIGGSQRALSASTKALIKQIEQQLGIKLSVGPQNRTSVQKDADDAAAQAKSAIANDTKAADVKTKVEVDSGH
ncbi:hypothetical protein [Sinomonas terrae]|uniref:Uncharacterized protein n=1 Tax=Sinomonas terrae TaxID=2908838 RepID=A0ABS9U3Y4_9MICC|nr:hypothetical protein [Sinomonas terrae]MCH6471281.1 hypothetical protein [Sinomonas terrae]